MAASIVLPSEYPLVLLAGVILCIECFMLGPALIGPTRFRIFNREFMAQFKEEHEKAFGEGKEPAAGGFPDCGDGRYSEKLDYKSWVEFNNAMRVHMNFVESLPLMLTIIVIAGLYLPLITMIIAFLNCGTRLIYIILYTKIGSDARVLPAIGGSLPLYLLGWVAFGIALYDAFKEGNTLEL